MLHGSAIVTLTAKCSDRHGYHRLQLKCTMMIDDVAAKALEQRVEWLTEYLDSEE